jgi:hypothetical protein
MSTGTLLYMARVLFLIKNPIAKILDNFILNPGFNNILNVNGLRTRSNKSAQKISLKADHSIKSTFGNER